MYHRRKPEILARHAVYQRNNRDAVNAQNSHRWHSVECPRRDRLCSLFERMSDSQRTRMANHMLTKGDPKLTRDSKVDLWLADYNSLE